jgi:hypothetical protein
VNPGGMSVGLVGHVALLKGMRNAQKTSQET